MKSAIVNLEVSFSTLVEINHFSEIVGHCTSYLALFSTVHDDVEHGYKVCNVAATTGIPDRESLVSVEPTTSSVGGTAAGKLSGASYVLA